MALIVVEDVATGIGRPISDDDERAQVEQWISDVELLIGARLGVLALLDQELLAYVEREAVVARMRYKDDRNSGRTSAAEDAVDTGEEHYFLRILDPWWALLSPGKSEGGALSVRPGFVVDTAMWPAYSPVACNTSLTDWDTPPS